MEIIRTTNLGYCYENDENGDAWALRGVDLSIQEGEFVMILGPNGSGKSTLAKHFNALLLPSEGEVQVMGQSTANAADHWQIRQRAGMVFQNPDNQIVATTVEEDVAFGPENLGIPSAEIRGRVDEALQAVGMTAFSRHAPHLLSGGQKQRVAIAGVIAMRPRCLILDEPTAMLDPRGRREVLETVQRLNKEEGITVIYITHFMEEAVAADRVVIMEQGSIVLDAKPREIFQQTDKLRAIGLDVPPVAELVQDLQQAGIDIPSDVMTVDELVERLCS
ncbi:energy-coupling factor transporter ATPase [Dethiobacter alkaliphilus]|uniref:Cobalt ABC transporter, ATPase subunit n=1 Tax=Dethiobacter alkaliphilus AHT 1 TaxID=555088 RepID=C0GG84_DETAL|nr:energy-coupling factor transporter ATPase [Dethiobacter alkaliphilus]EEG77773.1 cobalt ABC transporter, ATPase subunit [Dethiobacter alkaliphilus AHT 1]